MKTVKVSAKLQLLEECPSKYLCIMTDIIRIYEFPIFIPDDITAYCAIFYFYMKDYKKALELLVLLEKMLLSCKARYLNCEASSFFNKDIFGFKFSVMSLNECYYTMLLCDLLLEDYGESLKIANQLLITMPPQTSFWIILIRYLIQETLGQPSNRFSVMIGPKDVEVLKKVENTNFHFDKLMSTKQIQIELEYTDDRLISHYPYIEIPVGQYTIVVLKYKK
jgi:hypothetical protein